MLKLVFYLGLLVLTFVASGSSSKREDKKSSESNHQPIYSPSSQSSSGSRLDSSSQSYQPSSASKNSQYYYYYPVQEKPKVQDSSISGSELQPTYAASNFSPVRSNFDTTSVQSSSGDIYQGAAGLSSDQFGSFNDGQFGGTNAGHFGTQDIKSGFESGVNQLIAGGYGGFQGNPGGYAGYFPPSSSFNYHYGNEAGDYGIKQASNGFGLYSLAMPILGLIGLGLLLPTVTSLTGTSASTRRKREVGEMSDVFSSYRKKFEKYYSIYRSAVEDENCMNRIICELGSTMSDIKGKTIMINIVDKFVPNWMESKMGVFKMAALSRDGSQCSKYRCKQK
ncbi:uncharacterized protein LOC143230944 [Tachypleus tridentatus]|uniref:uncharacterized protein LOC143230944 n=1 Tax=Tachypleus tridentatus TaxID=6853 RepID=UPI003FD66720